jgi:hypothetical protein
MIQFEDFFKDNSIIIYLCRLRAKQASSRSKKHLFCRLTSNTEYNYHKTESENYSDYERKFNDDLTKLFPSRRKWKNIGKEARIKPKTNQKLSAVDKNIDSLLKTIRWFKRKKSTEPFLKNLDDFIKDIQISIKQTDFKIETPIVYPKLKEQLDITKTNKCRPIALFNLKDRIILSLTNKYLTELFDAYFQDCSFAFRAKNKTTNILPSHHDCIKAILKFKSEHMENALWSVECDMEKFYDSVNHKKIREHFYTLIDKAKEEFPENDFSIPVRIFEAYLNCYSFNINTLPLNDDTTYWAKHLKDKKGNTYKGSFGWVQEGLKKHNFYSDISVERIGVPQGGALSGLIANIVLDVADKEVMQTKVFYARFCDDMIILHPDKEECELAKKLYIDSLMELNLVPHEFCNELIVKRDKPEKNLPPTTIQPFWDEKSKGPYKWSAIKDEGFPWIGFVGYELHHEGHIRVRKGSFAKELKKQKDIIYKIKKAVEIKRRKSLGTVSESAIHSLVGMSVGRVQLKNFNKIEHEMCWNNGFKELTMNKFSVHQIKQLDKNRNKLYYKLDAELKEKSEAVGTDENPPKKRQIIDFNKPFSYYYQVLERKKL